MYQVTEKSTAHGFNTPHGYKTPHRYPVSASGNVVEILMGLVRQLYPTGRAWFLKKNSVFYNFHLAINRSFIRVIQDSKFTTDSVFPDNINFDENDATLLEYRLGLITNTSLDIAVRRQAILRKMSYPSNIKARQHPLFIQHQLQLAGFDVYIYENTVPYLSPGEIVSLSSTTVQHGGGTQHGAGTQHGSINFEVIANLSIENESYAIGGEDNLWATFFIGGATLGEVANVPSNRLQEFKELVLKLKPAHTVAFLFVNFV